MRTGSRSSRECAATCSTRMVATAASKSSRCVWTRMCHTPASLTLRARRSSCCAWKGRSPSAPGDTSSVCARAMRCTSPPTSPTATGPRTVAGRCASSATRPSEGTEASDRDDARLLVGALDLLADRHLQGAADRRSRLAWVDDVVDHRVAGGDVDIDDRAVVGDQLGLLRGRVLGLLDLLAEHDLHC